jgi:hypothetical protein
MFKDISYITLDDAATITCPVKYGPELNRGNKKNVSLASYYLAFHKNTWYELNFNAVPNFKYDKIYYQQKLEMDNPDYKNKTEWFEDLLYRNTKD